MDLRYCGAVGSLMWESEVVNDWGRGTASQLVAVSIIGKASIRH